MTMTLEKTRSEFEGIEEVESCKSERPQGYYVSWGKMNWSTIDANGNETSSQKYNYTWDAANRLVGVSIIGPVPTTQANNIQMTYDGKGRRVSITELHGTTVLTANTFVWSDEDLCEGRDSTGHTVNKRFYDQGEQISGTSYYYTFDHLDSIREMTDSSGTVHANYDWDAFGNQVKLAGDMDSDFGFTGFYVERTVNLDLTHYRAYDPDKAVWISRDPIEEMFGSKVYSSGVGDADLYRYVRNDPMGLVDTVGLNSGGPYHPPPGVQVGCTNADSCAAIQGKISILEKMIQSHTGWDRNNPAPRGGNRHTQEIADLWRAVANCISIYEAKCKQKVNPPCMKFFPLPLPFPKLFPEPMPFPLEI